MDPTAGSKTRIGQILARHGVSAGTFGADAVMYVSVTKAAMDTVGLRGGAPRLPLVYLTTKEKAELRNILKDMKIV